MLLVVTGSVTAQEQKNGGSEWNLVYENDENGKKLGGDLTNLIRAVRNGEPIRINFTIFHPTKKTPIVEHFADAKFITILTDSIVFAQIDPIVAQSVDMKNQFIRLEEGQEWAFSASTLGNNDKLYFHRKTGVITGHEPFKCGIRWYKKGK